MKIGVYALCKNEAKNIEAWLESCADADVICVTDTGSTDGSVELLQKSALRLHHGYVVPWRFDDAFNMALNHLSPDVDVAIRLDLDERLQPGWRAALEAAWTPETNVLRYPYVWSWKGPGEPEYEFYGDRIHSRANWRWSGATHEGLKCRVARVDTFTDALRIHQFPDRTKPRPNDLPLLEEAVRETPNDLRLWAYLGREYFWRKQFKECVRTYLHFLTLPGDPAERMMAYTHLAVCEPERAIYYLSRAIAEAPEYREPWVDLMTLHYAAERWDECYAAACGALRLDQKPMTYVVQAQAWGSYPHDICAIAAFRLGLVDVAQEQVRLAIAKSPHDDRLKTNLELFQATRAA